jgi:hypothetical protein
MDEQLPFGTTPRRRRRRGLLWAIFGLTGLLMSAAWATGFATSQTTGSGSAAANAVGIGATDPQSESPYAGLVTENTALDITFDGLWGQIENDTIVFSADLTGLTGTFYTDIYVDNLPFENTWTAAQFKWQQVDCTTPNWDTVDIEPADDGVGEPKLMNITTTDAHVSFPGLTGGNVYCFGLSSTDLSTEVADTSNGEDKHADDEDGTFLTRPDPSSLPTLPQFTAIVNRSA